MATRISVRLLLSLFVALFAGTAAFAQEGDPEEVKYRWTSPRDTMRAFLDGMVEYNAHGQERYRDQALSALDFEGEDAARYAAMLYDAFNRVEYVRYEELPGRGAPEIADGTYRRVFGPPPSDDSARIEVEFVRGADGVWRISSETVLRIESVWERVRDLPVLEELPFLSRIHYRIRGALPASLTGRAFVLENWQWLGLVVLAFLAVLVDRLVRAITAVVLRRLAKGEHLILEDESIEGFGKPMGWLFAALVFGFFLPALDLEPQILSPIDIAAGFVATVAGVWAAYRLVDVFCGALAERASHTDNKFDDVLVPLIRRTLKIVVAIVGAVYLASKWTDDLWGVVAGLGVGSIAVAFAGRDTIENLFGTFTVLLDKPFELDDWIVVGSNEGTVEDVGFRSTRIRTFYNSIITVPNRTFITGDVDNMGKRRYRRIKTMLALTYDTPPEKVEAFCAGVRRIIATHPYTRKDYYHVYFNEFGDSALNVLLYAFLECPDWATELREKHRLFADILRLAEGLNVGFAFPTQTLHMAKPEDLEHPDRPASDPDGERVGREMADAIVEKTLAPYGGRGAVPPPAEVLADGRVSRGSEEEAGE